MLISSTPNPTTHKDNWNKEAYYHFGCIWIFLNYYKPTWLLADVLTIIALLDSLFWKLKLWWKEVCLHYLYQHSLKPSHMLTSSLVLLSSKDSNSLDFSCSPTANGSLKYCVCWYFVVLHFLYYIIYIHTLIHILISIYVCVCISIDWWRRECFLKLILIESYIFPKILISKTILEWF